MRTAQSRTDLRLARRGVISKKTMDLRVLGCHGGETSSHRTSAFLLDETLSLDAGALAAGLDLAGQCRLEATVISHAHMDHVRDLAMVADNRCQNDCPPLVVAGTRGTLDILRKHFFNNLLWPDFSVLPTPESPTIRFLEIEPERPVEVAGRHVLAIPVNHTIETCAFIVESGGAAIGYSGDTGPTDRFWEVLNTTQNLRAVLVEVSYPNAQQKMATLSGHHTPKSLAVDLRKLEDHEDLPTLLHHIKPTFQSEVERECARLKGLNLSVLGLGDQFVL